MSRRWLIPPLCVVGLLLLPGAARADDYKDEIAAARERANAAADELFAAESDLDVLEQELVDLQHTRTVLEAELAALGAEAQVVAVSSFVHRETLSLDVVELDQRIRAETFTEIATRGTTDAADRYRAALQDAAALDATLVAKGEQAEDLRVELAAKEDAAVAELDKLVELQRQLEEEERRRREEEARKKAAEEAARRAAAQEAAAREAAARQAAAPAPTAAPAPAGGSGGGGAGGSSGDAARPAPVLVGGDWLCPVAGPVAFADTWGAPRSGGRKHKGTDMMSPRGTPVVASVSGNVRFKTGGNAGLSFYLDGDDGIQYFGGHLHAYEGAARRVEAGEVIGYVGNTGNARGGAPHLHFEIKPGGVNVNPYPTVRAHC